MPNIEYITPAHVARVARISANRARVYLQDEVPRDAPRLHQRFEPSRLDELAALCESKRQRRCFNRLNARPIESAAPGEGIN